MGLLIISFIEGEQLTYSNLSKMSITKTQVLGELHFKFMWKFTFYFFSSCFAHKFCWTNNFKTVTWRIRYTWSSGRTSFASLCNMEAFDILGNLTMWYNMKSWWHWVLRISDELNWYTLVEFLDGCSRLNPISMRKDKRFLDYPV